ncbi:hypothetical protein N1027_18355 [Herbiconiux sp. CPCC 205763]|uniref:Uncharacterized protein n=1 Tax=Herbiconiux aconitum TaxID=2970913 RepID=A0ABT2GV58_9MICO|nr:DUF6578 domain-containing protein [Herbiconiux aconitum]MCS5720097.1 hypothetical protein [Herbiconiux aconitum]
MEIGVQVASWEQQCCGERFAVGDRIEWQIFAADAVGFLGPEKGHDVRFGESHHGGLDFETMAVAGEITGIREVRQAVRRAGDGEPWTTVIGSSTGIDVDHVAGRETIDPGEPESAPAIAPPASASARPAAPNRPAPQGTWTIGPSRRERPDPADAHVGWVVRLRVDDGTPLPRAGGAR